MTEGRTGTLMRESVVQNVAVVRGGRRFARWSASRSSENLTLLGLASAVKREWVAETFPGQMRSDVECLFDRTHKRVAAVRLERFRDLVIHHEHQRDIDPAASGKCLAEAQRKGMFELPFFNHELKQFINRVDLVCAASPELEFPAFTERAIINCLARAFAGLTLVKEAQDAQLKEEFANHLAPEQRGWLDELAPTSILWPDGRKHKLLYAECSPNPNVKPNPPELQIKLPECFPLKEHPRICENKVPVKLWLCTPDGKRLEATTDWPAFRAAQYPKLKAGLQKKFPGTTWL